jgi:hypothetical protein
LRLSQNNWSLFTILRSCSNWGSCRRSVHVRNVKTPPLYTTASIIITPSNHPCTIMILPIAIPQQALSLYHPSQPTSSPSLSSDSHTIIKSHRALYPSVMS